MKTTLSDTVTLIQNWKCYRLSMPEMECDVMKASYAHISFQKRCLFKQRQLNQKEMGYGDYAT